jgi:hypothetical protein
MPYLLLGIALLVLLLLAARSIVNADAQKLGRLAGWFVVGLGATLAAVLVIVLIASDRLFMALAIAGGVAPLVMRRRAHWRRHYGSATGSASGRSEVETALLRMRLDHQTGAMSGEVRRGSFAGRQLEDLSQSELLTLWRQCVAEDEQGARLLETYLDRLRPDWRKAADPAATPGETMTRAQAYAILDLAPGANAAQIKEAYHRLMMKLHPDHGGSTFLAAQINRAKDMLLGE